MWRSVLILLLGGGEGAGGGGRLGWVLLESLRFGSSSFSRPKSNLGIKRVPTLNPPKRKQGPAPGPNFMGVRLLEGGGGILEPVRDSKKNPKP